MRRFVSVSLLIVLVVAALAVPYASALTLNTPPIVTFSCTAYTYQQDGANLS